MISLQVKYVKELITTFNPGQLAIQRNLMRHRTVPGSQRSRVKYCD
jgi:hypothetical protein